MNGAIYISIWQRLYLHIENMSPYRLGLSGDISLVRLKRRTLQTGDINAHTEMLSPSLYHDLIEVASVTQATMSSA